MKSHQFELTKNMKKLKTSLPAWKDGGFSWQEYAYIGMLEHKNRRKFNRENELYDLVKDIKE